MYIKTSEQAKLKLGFGDYSCNWGTHICGLYETEQERDEIVFGFLHTGYHNNNFQLYSPADRDVDDFVDNFNCYCPECSEAATKGESFMVVNSKKFYYTNEGFSPLDTERKLKTLYNDLRSKWNKDIRATAEMGKAISDNTIDLYDFMAYEARLNYFIAAKQIVSICLYDITKLSGELMMNVLKTHPYTITGKIFTQNPYYVEPGEWLKQNAPKYVLSHEK